MKTYRERTENITKKIRKEKRSRARKIGIVSALSCVFAFLFAFNLVLFVPYTTGGAPDLSQYRGSEYYPVMQKLAPLTYDAPKRANNFERWGFGELFSSDLKGGVEDWGVTARPTSPGSASSDMSGSNSSGSSGDRYEEVTNNQVDGVTEGDLFKRSNNTLFYLSYKNNETTKRYDLLLRAYSIAGEDSALLSELSVAANDGMELTLGGNNTREMYLSEDCKTVTALVPAYGNRTRYTAIITVDVQNPHTMSVIGMQYVSGNYVSSRVQGDVLLLVNNFSVYRNPDFSDETSFLPQYGTANALKSLPVEDIYLPENATRAKYTVLATAKIGTGELIDAEALLSFSDEVYVSKDNIYVTNSFIEIRAVSYMDYSVPVTEITRVAYEGGMLEVGASETMDGTVTNRYSMDEFEGNFRVFVTAPSVPQASENNTSSHWLGTSASLYVFDAETMEMRASVERFCPERETVQSARFDKNLAYVCTANTATFFDPVYEFDLTDLENITSKDTGVIAGFSSNLAKFTYGTLLGIGYGEWRGMLKIEIYGVTETSVESIAAYQEAGEFSTDFKSYFIDADEGLIGLGFFAYGDYESGYGLCYLLLRFDGYELTELRRVQFSDSYRYDYKQMRAFLADGWFYIVGEQGLNVEYIG